MVALRLAAQLHHTCCSLMHINHLNWIYCAQQGLFEEYFSWRWEHRCLSWRATPPPTPAVTLVNISFVLILMESQHCTTVPLKTLELIKRRNNNVMENNSTQSCFWQHEKGLLRTSPLPLEVRDLIRNYYFSPALWVHFGGLMLNWKIAPAQIPSVR